jgi:hypothetical protein
MKPAISQFGLKPAKRLGVKLLSEPYGGIETCRRVKRALEEHNMVPEASGKSHNQASGRLWSSWR